MRKKLVAAINHPGLRKYAKNGGWLLLEHFFKAVVAVFVGFYVGRYLGPDKFGVLSYLTSIVALVAAASRLGLDGVVVRELLDVDHEPDVQADIIGTAYWLQVGASVILSCIAIGVFFLSGSAERQLYWVLILCVGVCFQSFSVVDWYFQYRVQSVVVVRCRILANAISSGAKIVGVWFGFPLDYFIVIFSVEYMVLALLYLCVAYFSGLYKSFYCFSKRRALRLISSSWPLLVSAVAVTVYTKIDQVMIGSMLGDRDVGIYSAALKFYEAWVVIPYLLSISLLPAIKRAKDVGGDFYERRLVLFFRGMFWASMLVGAVLELFSERLIDFAYGKSFDGAADILGVVMFSASWVALGNCSARYCITERLEKYILTRAVFAALLNVALNLWFIPHFGIAGAAYATLLSMFFANYVMDWFSIELRPLLRVKHKAILFLK